LLWGRKYKTEVYQDNYSAIYSHEVQNDADRLEKAKKFLSIINYEFVETRQLSVLEIGCFTGSFSTIASNNFKSWTGIDIDISAIEMAKIRNVGNKANFEVMNAEKLSFNDGTFDLVLCNHIYEHVPNPSEMMNEIYRVLNDRGACYFAAGNKFKVMEPHHRLPFLSWLPQRLANIYLSAFSGEKKIYFERHLSRRNIMGLCKAFTIRDYTLKIISNPEDFYFPEMVSKNRLSRFLIKEISKLAPGLISTYIFILHKGKMHK
jgi:2-polyprenyl-3-methyl-5-hydroxy-6-metoxy-1,4-benzoquinol methylase